MEPRNKELEDQELKSVDNLNLYSREKTNSLIKWNTDRDQIYVFTNNSNQYSYFPGKSIYNFKKK